MTTTTHPSILIIGAGPAGICMGARLRDRGETDFVIAEKAATLGGTWRDNVYPGVACDVPAQYYGYSFQPNAEARTTFATGAELFDYFERVAVDHGVVPHIRYGTEIVSATWTGSDWEVVTAAGAHERYRVVVTAVGRLHRPRLPDIEGLGDFGGILRHSADWSRDIDLAGLRVGVVGTGSSAVQITSAASEQAAHLDLFQRTAQWVLPMANDPVPESVRQEMRASPAGAKKYYDLVEAQIVAAAEAAFDVGSDRVEQRDAAVRDALAAVRDPVLRAKLTPGYAIGCKRLIVSGTFYDAVQRPNVSVVTEPIARVERDGVRTTDGGFRPLDALVLATGFHADSYLRPMRVTGLDRVDLDELWADGFLSYKSVALPCMPNLFTINGPFSPGGSLSILAVIEHHVSYVLRLLERIRTDEVSIVPKRGRAAELLDDVRERAKQTVWYTGGCTSWYLDKDGVPIVAPLTLKQLEEDLRAPRWDDFEITALASTDAR